MVIVTRETPESWILNHKLGAEAEDAGHLRKKIAYVLPDDRERQLFGERVKALGFKWSACRGLLSCDRLEVRLLVANEPNRARGLRFHEFWCDPYYKDVFDNLNFCLLTRTSRVF